MIGRTGLALALLLSAHLVAADDAAPAAPAPAAAPAPGARIDVRALFERELPPLPVREFASADGQLHGKAEAAGPVTVEAGEDALTVSVPLGTQTPVTCTVVPRVVDTGSVITAILKGLPAAVQLAQVRPVEVAAAGDRPVIFVEALYLTDGPQGKLAGLLKVAVALDGERSVVCEMDEPGYAATFRRVVTGLLASAVTRDGARWLELRRVELNGHPVGFAVSRIVEGQGGRSAYDATEVLLVPRSPTDLVTRDEVLAQESDAQGEVVRSVSATVESGETESFLTLQRAEDGSYGYDGTFKGKALHGTFRAKAPLRGELAQMAQVRALLARGQGEERALCYLPSVDPARPVEEVLKLDPSRPRGMLLQVGPMEVRGVAEADGTLGDAEVALGAATLRFRRLLARGTP